MDSLRDSVRRFLNERLGQKVKNIPTNDPLFKEAYGVVEGRLVEGKSVMESVWGLLIEASERMPLNEETVRKWQLAVEALLPYAINLYLAPNRPEFKQVKLFSSYYVHKIKGFVAAEAILAEMGYTQPQPDSNEVVLGPKPKHEILQVITNMVILHQELEVVRELVQHAVAQGLRERVRLHSILTAKIQSHTCLEDIWHYIEVQGYHQEPFMDVLPQTPNSSFPVTYETPSSMGLSSPEVDNLPAPALTQTQMMAMLNGGSSDQYPNPFQDCGYGSLTSEFYHSITYDALSPSSLPAITGSGDSELCDKGSSGKSQRSGNTLGDCGFGNTDTVVTSVDDYVEDKPCPFVIGDRSGTSTGSDHETFLDHAKLPPPTYQAQANECSQKRKQFEKSRSIDEGSSPRQLPSRVKSSSNLGAQAASKCDMPSAIWQRDSPQFERQTYNEHRTVPTSVPQEAHALATTTATSKVMKSSQDSSHWMCDRCGLQNCHSESECLTCPNKAPWITTATGNTRLTPKLGGRVVADGSRRTESDGPAPQKMHPAETECPDCMYLIPIGMMECPACKKWISGSAKGRKILKPRTWF